MCQISNVPYVIILENYNIMFFRTVNCLLFRRCMKFIRFKCENKKVLSEISRNIFVGTTEVFLGTEICCAIVSPLKKEKMDIEEVQKALHEGDLAIIKLMEELKDFVKVVSEEYRNCLNKQIEITEKSQSIGPFSESWDELPHYRTLADELLQQLNNYKALFETLGKMTETRVSVGVLQENNIFNNICEKFTESKEIIQMEFEENRKLEIKLLQLNCDNILMDVLTDNAQN